MNSSNNHGRTAHLSEIQQQQFGRDGFLVVNKMASIDTCNHLLDSVNDALCPPLAPLEYETDVSYPGAPHNFSAVGGRTPRRLLNAFARDQIFRQWARNEGVVNTVRQLLGGSDIQLTQNHHNCVMTKYPAYSSETHWHQDIRYWSFDRPELISVWLALGEENTARGGMQLIPGSHKLDLDRGRFDAALFLRADLPENQSLVQTAVSANLQLGDVLFFHCRTFHAAGANRTETVKYSLVYSYHQSDNAPIPETRSARYAEVSLA
jgi:phytanoyl-CoA hydroxylase